MANNNFRVESQKFFNAQTTQNHRSWAKAAAAYFRQVGASNKTNFVDAMATYYAKLNAGTISAPVSPSSTQKLVSNGDNVPVRNSPGTVVTAGPATVAGGAITAVTLPAAQALVGNTTTTNVPITFTTARTAGQQATVVATYTVAGGVITAITIA